MRKLAIACLSFSAAIFASKYIFPLNILPFLCVLAIVPAVYFILRPAKFLRGIIISLFFISAGFAVFYASAQNTVIRAEKLSGQSCSISAKLISYPVVYDDYCRAEIKLKTNGLPSFKAILYDNSELIANAKPGDMLSFSGSLKAAGKRYGEEYDLYYSKNIFFTINSKSDVNVKTKFFDLATYPQRLNKALTDHIASVFPEDTAAFAKSLLVGDKSDLYEIPGQYSSLNRAGLAHVVAVSGMHIAFLVSALQLIIGKSRKSSVLAIGLIWIFVLLSGASPSAVRAGVMQSILLMAPVFRRENDAVSSLSFALALILVFNPYACASVSLQLSFAAMAGIMAYASRISDALIKLLPSRLRTLAITTGTSVAGMIFTVPLVAVHFGVVNTLSVLSNALALWAVSICFCGSYLACGIALISAKLGAAVAWLVSWLIRYILFVADIVSSIPLSTVYLNNAINIAWIILTYLFILIFAFSNIKIHKKLILSIGFSAITLFMASFSLKISNQSRDGVFSVLDVGQGQCISLFSKDKTVVIDCGAISTLDNAGETASAYLLSRGRKQVDLLVLTHLHADHANGVENLLELCRVGKIIMPINADDEDGLLDEIIKSADRQGTIIEYISDKQDICLDMIRLQLWEPQGVGDANERGLIIQASLGDYDMLITGDASSSVEKKLVKDGEIQGIDTLVVGHHGSRYSSCGAFLEYLGAENAVISCGYNTFGHPTHETLARLKAYGYNIYRTDLSGNIEIRLG